MSYIFHFKTAFNLEVLTYELPAPVGYETLKGTKIAFFSDLHMLKDDIENVKQVIEKINEENPDIVIFGGDLLATMSRESYYSSAEIFPHIKGIKAPIYGVLGNHDWRYNLEDVAGELKKSKAFIPLENSSIVINNKFNLIGVSDHTAPNGVQITKAMEKIDKNLPIIGFSHRPEEAILLPDNVKIMFAGHTHGAQINIPILTELMVLRAKYIDRTMVKGHVIKNNDRHIFVSKGIGTSFFRIRINCPSDIIVLKIT